MPKAVLVARLPRLAKPNLARQSNASGEVASPHHKEIKQSEMSASVASRSARLFYNLQQSLQKFERGMEQEARPCGRLKL